MRSIARRSRERARWIRPRSSSRARASSSEHDASCLTASVISIRISMTPERTRFSPVASTTFRHSRISDRGRGRRRGTRRARRRGHSVHDRRVARLEFPRRSAIDARCRFRRRAGSRQPPATGSCSSFRPDPRPFKACSKQRRARRDISWSWPEVRLSANCSFAAMMRMMKSDSGVASGSRCSAGSLV